MHVETGEIKTLEEVQQLPQEERLLYKRVPTKHAAAAKQCIANKRPGWKSISKDLNAWAKSVKRKAKAQRKRRKASIKKNRNK